MQCCEWARAGRRVNHFGKGFKANQQRGFLYHLPPWGLIFRSLSSRLGWGFVPLQKLCLHLASCKSFLLSFGGGCIPKWGSGCGVEASRTCFQPQLIGRSKAFSGESSLILKVKVTVVSDSLRPHGLYSPWNSPGQNSGVSSRSLLEGIFPTQGSNPGLLHCRQILYQLIYQGRPRVLEWVAYPFFSGSSRPRNWTRVSCIAGGFFTAELLGKSSLILTGIESLPLGRHCGPRGFTCEQSRPVSCLLEPTSHKGRGR